MARSASARLWLFAALLLAAPVAAQPADGFDDALAVLDARRGVSASGANATVPDLAGVYRAGPARLYVAADGGTLRLRATGQAAFDALTGRKADAGLNEAAERLLVTALRGDLSEVRAAVSASRRAEATRDFARFLHLLTEGHGRAEEVTVLGTLPVSDARAVTYAHVRFERGWEVVKLGWHEGALALLNRGGVPAFAVSPVTAQPTRFSVLGPGGEPVALLAFDGDRATVEGNAPTFVARRPR